MFIPAYLSVILYRPLHSINPDDSNVMLMTGELDLHCLLSILSHKLSFKLALSVST